MRRKRARTLKGTIEVSAHDQPSAGEQDSSPSGRILILGGGYGGVRVAQRLGKYLDAPDIVLVDHVPEHQFVTELADVAGGRRAALDVAYPLAPLLTRAHTRFVQAGVQAIDPANATVRISQGAISYRNLVIALGSITAFYGVPGLAEHALTLKSVDDAEAIRDRATRAIQIGAREQDPNSRAAWLTVIVGGGGLSGVELAGELAALVPVAARANGIDPREAKIVLVEGSPTVVPALPARLQIAAKEILTDLGVQLVLGTRVAAADETGVSYGLGGRIPGRTLIWTGGIMAPPLLRESGLPTARGGQVIVDAHLRVPEHPAIYAIGDAAWIVEPGSTRAVVASAQNAIEQAEAVAYNIFARTHGYPERPYHSHDRGQVVSVGNRRGVASLFHLQLRGRTVAALKELIEEAYRFEATGHFRVGRHAGDVPAVAPSETRQPFQSNLHLSGTSSGER
jgi:NADH dehydrogenase